MEWMDVITSTTGIKAERVLGLLCVLSLTLTVFSKEKSHKTEEVLRMRYWWLKLTLWAFPFFVLIMSAEVFGDGSIKYVFGVGQVSWK